MLPAGAAAVNITMIKLIAYVTAPFLFLFSFSGCYPRPKAPIDTLRYDSHGDHQLLFVFLPGHGDSLDCFEKKGFVRAVRSREPAIDMITVNAHLGYYMEGTIVTRLKEDVIDPAKAVGYKGIWLIGNSLGGYGSILYARQHPGDIAGVVLLGPFLGERKTISEIAEAGGLHQWEPGEITDTSRKGGEKKLWKWLKDSGEQQNFWHWLKDCDGKSGDCPSRIYLGYGKRDRFSYGQKLMAEVLPAENVFVIDGGHNWETWTSLWNLILDKMVRMRQAAGTGWRS